jgi:hypothetical protein
VLIPHHRLLLAAAMVLAATPSAAARAEEPSSPRASTTYSYSILHSRAPAPVVDSARAHLVRWMGQELVERHVTLDSTASTYIAPPLHTASEPGPPVAASSGSGGSAASVLPQPGWRLKFQLRDPKIPCAHQPVVVQLDAGGTLLGISSTVAFDAPEPGCAFTVGRDRAVDLARSDGLAAGLKPWAVQLSWVPRYERFAWSLSNTIEDGGVCSSNGETYIIDAKTGAILERSSWSRRC